MPEGDTVWAAAKRLNTALAGKVLTRTDFRVPSYATVNLAGLGVTEVRSRGKHLLIRVGTAAEAVTVHSHLKMEGAWHIYPAGGKWRRPAFTARAILETADVTAVGFSLGKLEVIARAKEDAAVGHLGPDLLGPDWDSAEAVRRLRADPARPIGLALLDQRNLAGIGNVYRNDLCFLSGVHPLAPVGTVPRIEQMVDTAQRLLEVNRERAGRTTTGMAAQRSADRLWVHGRSGQPCRRCGTTILRGSLGDTALEERDIYFCPHCQPQSPDGTAPITAPIQAPIQAPASAPDQE